MLELELENVASGTSSEKAQRWFDRADINRVLSLYGLFYSWLFCTACIVLGTVGQINPLLRTVELTPIGREALVLTLNVLITLANEASGWIHMVTLRWTLCKEGKLHFNSNLKILAGTETSRPNSWYSNVIILIGIIMTYTSSSLIFLTGIEEANSASKGKDFIAVCGQALITLSFGILVQVAIATWSLTVVHDIPTWSIDPLDTAAAAEFHRPSHARRPNRCLRGVDLASSPSKPTYPKEKQVSLYKSQPAARRIVWLVWIPVILAALWGGIVFFIVVTGESENGEMGSDWFLLPAAGTPQLKVGWYDGDTQLPTKVFAWTFCLIALLQAILTLTLQCAGLLVNASRDESFWRKIGRPQGQPRLPPNLLVYVLGSWQYVGLIIFKPLLHWLFGLAVTIELSEGVYMRPPQIMYLTIGATMLAIFITFLARRQPKGPQPATYGHLQTIIDMIDYWPRQEEMMYWGHKDDGDSLNGGVAHAGISSQPLPSVKMGVLYA